MSEEDKKLEEDINMLVQRLQVGVIFFLFKNKFQGNKNLKIYF